MDIILNLKFHLHLSYKLHFLLLYNAHYYYLLLHLLIFRNEKMLYLILVLLMMVILLMLKLYFGMHNNLYYLHNFQKIPLPNLYNLQMLQFLCILPFYQVLLIFLLMYFYKTLLLLFDKPFFLLVFLELLL